MRSIKLAGSMPLSSGTKLGPYEILSRVGAGGMGEVYKARDTRLERIVAIKQCNGVHKARFEKEARVIAALNHPHICQILDVGPGYLVMEYIDGKTVSGPLRVDEALKLALEIASGIEDAHGKGILHRDLKPANILVTAAGSAKILDLGLANLMTESDPDATRTTDGAILGAPAYMAPEQAGPQIVPGQAASALRAYRRHSPTLRESAGNRAGRRACGYPFISCTTVALCYYSSGEGIRKEAL
jgi:serine/threonine protein kinase